MNRIITKFTAAFLSIIMAAALIPAVAFAGTSHAGEIVTLGANLTKSERAQVLDFFGLTEDDLDEMTVITVTNKDEHNYCDASIPSSVIGTQTQSCSYIQPTTSGGINVRTANLNYVTSDILYNALQTAGVENCNLVVTSPFEVSGTGALTGIFMAYKESGDSLDSDKESAAVEEMYETAQLQDTYGDDIVSAISDAKDAVISSTSDMTDEEIKQAIEDAAAKYGIELSDSDLDELVSLLSKLKSLDYDLDSFSETLANAQDALNNAASQATGFIGWLQNVWSSITNFFSGLFGGSSSSSSSSILDNLDTSVFQLDN